MQRQITDAMLRFCTPPRIQGFEFCDQPWLKGIWREAYLDGLNFIFSVGGVYRRMLEPFARWARAAGGSVIQDLGSGGGQPVASVVTQANRAAVHLPRIVLSDLNPDLDGFRTLAAAHPGRVDYVAHRVDATEAGEDGVRLFSICGVFHHFPPARARRVLRRLAERGDGIFIQEVLTRHWLAPLLCVFNLIPLMLAPFFCGRLTAGKVLISTVFPIIPLMIMADGVASVFRTYRRGEIEAMLPERCRREWHWESGVCRVMGILRAPYVYGYRLAAGKELAAALESCPVPGNAGPEACLSGPERGLRQGARLGERLESPLPAYFPEENV